jgi:hypothetical protein
MIDLPKPSSLNRGLGFCFAPAAGRTQEGAEELGNAKGETGSDFEPVVHRSVLMLAEVKS